MKEPPKINLDLLGTFHEMRNVQRLNEQRKDECGFGVDVRYDFPQVDTENAEYTYVEGNAIVYNIFGKPIEGYENVHYKAKITPDLTCTLEEFSK